MLPAAQLCFVLFWLEKKNEIETRKKKENSDKDQHLFEERKKYKTNENAEPKLCFGRAVAEKTRVKASEKNVCFLETQ